MSDQQLLRDYAKCHSDIAFAELVRRHVDLVYSAAFRMVCEAHSAKDVTQAVFVALAQNAPQLTNHPVLFGWLHCTARNLAAKAVRGDARRRAREQEAAAMSELLANESDAPWERIAPHLDAALGELSEADRDALLLRYFERKSAREMAQTLGISDEAAQKRVSRAVERLRECFAQRGVTVSASGLVVVISANAVQAAPVGLAITISTAAALAGTSIPTTAIATATKAITMTTLQKTIVTAAFISAVGVAFYEARQVARLREENRSLQQQHAPLASQIEQLQRNHDAATRQIAALTDKLASTNKSPSEVLKLRGQVGVLRQEKAEIGSKSALSKITADPETRKAMREQQKMGMSFIYGDLVKRLKLAPEPAGQLNDLLADSVMDNIDTITQALHDKKSSSEIEQLFSAQDLAMQAKVATLLGPDGLAEYKDYSKNIVTDITAMQFEKSLAGDTEAKAQKKAQISRTMQEEIQSALAAAGLAADFQTLPMLNFRNIASEEFGEQSLKLMDNVFERVAARAAAFLTPDELKKWQEFGKAAVDNNRTALLMNRKMMAPIAQ